MLFQGKSTLLMPFKNRELEYRYEKASKVADVSIVGNTSIQIKMESATYKSW